MGSVMVGSGSSGTISGMRVGEGSVGVTAVSVGKIAAATSSDVGGGGTIELAGPQAAKRVIRKSRIRRDILFFIQCHLFDFVDTAVKFTMINE